MASANRGHRVQVKTASLVLFSFRPGVVPVFDSSTSMRGVLWRTVILSPFFLCFLLLSDTLSLHLALPLDQFNVTLWQGADFHRVTGSCKTQRPYTCGLDYLKILFCRYSQSVHGSSATLFLFTLNISRLLWFCLFDQCVCSAIEEQFLYESLYWLCIKAC